VHPRHYNGDVPNVYKPDLMLIDGEFVSGAALRVGDDGKIEATSRNAAPQPRDVVHELRGKALLPGLVNAHSHSFQRLIRGRSETRGDNFWSWRHVMYAACAQLSPEDVYDVARMAFLEMALNGITTVGEFHYLHRQPDGSAYDDGNELAHQVIAAARSVGIRIALLRSAYFRAGFKMPPDPGQSRFYETLEEYLANCFALHGELGEGSDAWFGFAPHSIRAVPLRALETIADCARQQCWPVHIHAAEQRIELEQCRAEYGRTPVQLLADSGILDPEITLIHAVHISDDELSSIAESGATVCACPTTERNLGDGIVRANDMAAQDIFMAFGTDSQAQINLLEDARELEYHLRLQQEKRLLLDHVGGKPLAARVFSYATEGGANALGANAGSLAKAQSADFFTVDLNDVAIAGAAPEHLLSAIVFTADRCAVRDVWVRGRQIVSDGRHAQQEEIVAKYAEVSRRIWRV
jgi:formimidoylglutamate deiminase